MTYDFRPVAETPAFKLLCEKTDCKHVFGTLEQMTDKYLLMRAIILEALKGEEG